MVLFFIFSNISFKSELISIPGDDKDGMISTIFRESYNDLFKILPAHIIILKFNRLKVNLQHD